MFQVPSVVSATEGYTDIIDNGRTGFIASNSDEWRNFLGLLIENRELRLDMGRQAKSQALHSNSFPSGVRALREALSSSISARAPKRDSSCPKTELRKPRVIVCNTYFYPQSFGGATRVVENNINYILESAGDEYEILVFASDYMSDESYAVRIDSYKEVPVVRVKAPGREAFRMKSEDNRVFEIFEDLIDRFNPDIIHFHCIQYLTGSIVEAALLKQIPYIITVHDGWWVSDHQFLVDELGHIRRPKADLLEPDDFTYDMKSESIARRQYLFRLLDAAYRVLAVSGKLENIYRGAGITNICTVANGLTESFAIPRSPRGDGKIRLGHVGGLTVHKGAILLEVVLKSEKFSNIELFIVSHDYGSSRQNEVWGSTQVHYISPVPPEEMGTIYGELDVLIAPSVAFESFGLVTREAALAGLWVIASDRGAVGDDVRPDVDGTIVDVTNTVQLREILRTIDAHTCRYTKPPHRNGGHVRTAKDQAHDIMAIYSEMLSESRVE
ncbi:hypothetical protein GCM10007885_00010 [Methylobacterium gnaphalii]|nr:hypothetical protein GCM10007885_00010 [Methylobacterium gnaphalii]